MKVELLSPAKNLECGIEAVLHGADAVYIGGPRFSARAAAGNSLEDIEELTRFAHVYNVKIYVALNTILKEEELAETEQTIWRLYRAGVDALIVQDMAIMNMNLPPIALHASTQTDNRTTQKVKFLSEAGFTRVVLARELTLEEISEIHKACPEVELEVFVHGALCVSYSGQCYASQYCFGRSANRGECAQFCRLQFNMEDAEGRAIAKDKHLLSLKDLNQSDNLEALLDAGVMSLKIEGRLKDVAYVKNVTAYYNKKLDLLLKQRNLYQRTSSGTVRLFFNPQAEKSFNRGFTEYFLKGRTKDIFSPDTPKSLGEEVGTVKDVRKKGFIIIAGVKPFNNGDGLCFIDANGKLQGFRVNRAENNRIYPQQMPKISPKTKLYRNFDQEFEKSLKRKSAERLIFVSMRFSENQFGFTLTVIDEDGNSISVAMNHEKEIARTPQIDNIKNQLGKLGGTVFEAKEISIDLGNNWFIPSSELTELRRNAVERLLAARRINYKRQTVKIQETRHDYISKELTYLGNVMNSQARDFYRRHGVTRVAPAFESGQAIKEPMLMACKHCLRHSMGWCPKYDKKRSQFKEPYFLVSGDGKRFRLEFDCKQCQMKVYAER